MEPIESKAATYDKGHQVQGRVWEGHMWQYAAHADAAHGSAMYGNGTYMARPCGVSLRTTFHSIVDEMMKALFCSESITEL